MYDANQLKKDLLIARKMQNKARKQGAEMGVLVQLARDIGRLRAALKRIGEPIPEYSPKKRPRPKGIARVASDNKTVKRKVSPNEQLKFKRKGVDYVGLAKRMMAKLKGEFKGEKVPYLVFVSQMWNAMGREIYWRRAITEYREQYYLNIDKASPAKKRKR